MNHRLNVSKKYPCKPIEFWLTVTISKKRDSQTHSDRPDGVCHTGEASALDTFIAIFLYVYIEISIFIRVAHVMGVLLTLILVIFTSVIGMSLVRNQGFKNFLLMQQKMAAGESPAEEMIKSVSLILAGLLLILPGFFHRFPGLLLLLPPVQNC